MPIETTVIGSYTRPDWLIAARRAYEGGELKRDVFKELLRIAVRETVREQLDAGIDIITDGEQGRTSFWEYFTERIEGLALEGISYTFSHGATRPGIAVVDRLTRREGPSIEDVRHVKRLTSPKRLKVPNISVTFLATTKTIRISKSAYPSRDAYAEDLTQLLKEEYEATLRAGADIIQLDIPDFTHLTAKPRGEAIPQLKKNIDLINSSISRVPRHRLHAHMCYGNYKAAHRTDGTYANLLPDIYDLRVGTLCLEMANARHTDDIQLLKEYPPPKGMKIAVGAIDVKTPDVEPVWLVKKRLLRAAEYIDPKQLSATTDCGFAPTWDSDIIPRSACQLKLKNLAQGAKEASTTLGV